MKKNDNCPFFSVIVPIYKVEKYLVECLESICNQTFQDYELILVDDGSPDQCPVICDEYCKKDVRIKVIHKNNEGLVEARKTGIHEANGCYTVFVDGDDWVDSGLLMEAYNILQKRLVDIIAFDYYRNSENFQEVCRFHVPHGYYEGEKKRKDVCDKMICTGIYYKFGMAPSIATKIFKTELIREMLMQVDGRITMGEDAIVTYPAILAAENIVISPAAFYHYRDVQNSMSQKYNPNYFRKIEILMDCFERKQLTELASQLELYKLMLLEEGVLRALLQSDSLFTAIKEIKSVCCQERYRKILNSVNESILDDTKKNLITALKYDQYNKIYMMYMPVRMKRMCRKIVMNLIGRK